MKSCSTEKEYLTFTGTDPLESPFLRAASLAASAYTRNENKPGGGTRMGANRVTTKRRGISRAGTLMDVNRITDMFGGRQRNDNPNPTSYMETNLKSVSSPSENEGLHRHVRMVVISERFHSYRVIQTAL